MIPAGIGRYQTVARRVLKPIVSRLWDMRVTGLENVPADGPAVLCPNHAAAIDSLFLPSVLSRNLIYVGKSEYLDDWKTKHLFPALGMIPIDRRGGDHAAAALDAARQVLQGGGLFGIYPEGTRSRSGNLHKGHTGAARLAVETGAPVVPVGLLGTADVQSPESPWPRLRLPVTIRFGTPIEVTAYRSRVGDRALYRQLIDDVMYEIQQLTGLEYVDTYAGKKVETAAAPAAVGQPVGVGAAAAGDGATIERKSSVDVLDSRPLPTLDELLQVT